MSTIGGRISFILQFIHFKRILNAVKRILMFHGVKFFFSQVFDIGKNTNTPITGLEYFQVIGTDKYMIFATTPTKLYYFCGKAENEEKPLLQQVFHKYLNIPETETFMGK